MPTLSVCLFGRLNIQRQANPIALNALRAQELLCYLLLHQGRPYLREKLADTLWGDSSGCQSKKIMRQAIWHLQSATNFLEEPIEASVLQIESEWIQINPHINLWLDVALFEEAFALCRGIEGTQMNTQTAQALEKAVTLYQGDLLEGWYSDWCLCERERFQNIYLAILDKLMDYCAVQGKYETGIEYGRRSLRYDRARERTHRRLMRLQYLLGDRTAALRQYECCVTALNEELSVSPAHSTRALYQQIRMDHLYKVDTMVRMSDQSVDPLPVPLPKTLAQLEQLQMTLAHIQAQIAEDIRVVEHLMCI